MRRHVVLAVALLLIASLVTSLLPSPVQAQSWLSGWQYRKQITIDQTDDLGANAAYQMKLLVGKSSSATGGIVVSIDKTQLYSTSNETGNKDVSATVKNNSGSGKNITLYLSLTPLSPIEDDEIEIYKAKSTLTGFNTFVEGTKQHMLDVDNLTTKIVWIVPSFYLDNGAEKPIWLQFDVKTKTMVTWTIGLKAVDL